MKRLVLIIIILYSNILIYGQSISVGSFKLLDVDLTANTSGTLEKDQNGETAALIKVVTPETGFSFDCGSIGIVKTKQTPGEIWVYVPRGAKKMSIKHPRLGVLRDYYFPITIESARTYEIILLTGTIETFVKPSRTTQYVVFQLSPPNAVVELNGELLETNEGNAIKMMNFGTYDYRVQAPNYLSEAGKIAVNDQHNKHIINISLKPNFSKVTFVVENNAEIWVNGEMKGRNSWSANLGAGPYEIETKKYGCRTKSTTVNIVITEEPQTIELQAPTPIFGEADINSNPAMADIYIDGVKVGNTPQIVSNILVGEHNVRIVKKDFEESRFKMVIREDTISRHYIQLEKSEGDRNFSIGDVQFKMIKVDSGSFKLGNNKKTYLSSYYIGETEVTQELWEAVMGNNPSYFKGKNKPVEQVSWDDCNIFIEKLSEITGEKFDLPTEEEWEYAAIGGNKNKKYQYSGSDLYNEVSWNYENSNNRTHSVKTKKSNVLGIYDMSGNVNEWCKDLVDSSSDLINTDGKKLNSGTERVYRGGGWDKIGSWGGIRSRYSLNSDQKLKSLGLRLVLHNNTNNNLTPIGVSADSVLSDKKMIDVEFDCNIPDAIIFIDGEEYGEISELKKMEEGNHQIRVCADFFNDYTEIINPIEIEGQKYVIKLKPNKNSSSNKKTSAKESEQWEMIRMTMNSEEVAGMTNVGDVTEKYGIGGLSFLVENNRKRCIKRMKKAAAKLGASIILMGTPYETGDPVWGRPFMKMPGTAYK